MSTAAPTAHLIAQPQKLINEKPAHELQTVKKHGEATLGKLSQARHTQTLHFLWLPESGSYQDFLKTTIGNTALSKQ